MKDIPTIYWVVLSLVILLTIVFIAIPSFSPSNKFGHKPQKVRQKTTGFFKHNNPLKVWQILFGVISRISLPKVNKRKPVIVNDQVTQQVVTKQPEVDNQPEEYNQPTYIYDPSCQDWQVGDTYLGEYVSFVCTPYLDEYGNWAIVFYDPFIRNAKKRSKSRSDYSYFERVS